MAKVLLSASNNNACSSELYRGLPIRDALITSLVQSDLIGFQTFSFAKHFMSACTRLLGLIVNDKGVECDDGHFVTVDVMPVGINPEEYYATLEVRNERYLLTACRKNPSKLE